MVEAPRAVQPEKVQFGPADIFINGSTIALSPKGMDAQAVIMRSHVLRTESEMSAELRAQMKNEISNMCRGLGIGSDEESIDDLKKQYGTTINQRNLELEPPK